MLPCAGYFTDSTVRQITFHKLSLRPLFILPHEQGITATEKPANRRFIF